MGRGFVVLVDDLWDLNFVINYEFFEVFINYFVSNEYWMWLLIKVIVFLDVF